jgi:predicted nucleotidyltransferase
MDEHKIAIYNFVKEMGYLKNENVLGILFYGSYLRGTNREGSDIDMHIIYNNKLPHKIIRGSKESNGIRVEYFEKPICDLYASIDNGMSQIVNSWVLLLSNAKIIFDRNGSIKKLQSLKHKT